MLPSFVDKTDAKGTTTTYLNSLRRYVRGAVVVPSQANGLVVVPTAGSATNPGVSAPTPIECPQDSNSEFNSLTGGQGLSTYGLGTISTVGTAITGLGTKFTQQLTVGSTIVEVNATLTIQSISSDTAAVAVANAGADVTNANYAITTPIITNAQNRLTCMIQDMAYQRYLMNNPIPVLHLFGDNQKPSMLCESLFMQSNQALRFQFYNWDTTGPASCGISMEARKWQTQAIANYPEVAARIKGLLQRKTFASPYWLTFDINTPGEAKVVIPASSGKAIGYMTNTGSNTLFLFFGYGHGIVNGGGSTGDTVEKFKMTIHDGETDRPYMNNEITLNCGLGTAQNPYWMPHPIILKPRNQLRIALTSLITSANTVDAFISFGGVAVLNSNTAIADPAILAEARRIYQATKPPLMAMDRFRQGM